MPNYKYAYQKFEPKEMARLVGRDLQISVKTAGEVASFIKGRQIDKAIAYLEQVVVAKKAIPFKKRVKDIPHRKGMKTGRFPKKTSEQVIGLLNQLKSNAQDKGLDTSKMIIVHAVAQRGAVLFHYGRRRTQRKNSHFEIIAKQVEEIKVKKKKTAKKEMTKEKPEEKKTTQSETKENKKEVSAVPTSKGGLE